MKIKMCRTVMNKVDGLPGPFVVGVEYEMSDVHADAFVASGLAEYVDAPIVAEAVASPTYETAVLTDAGAIETPEDAAPRAVVRHRRDR